MEELPLEKKHGIFSSTTQCHHILVVWIWLTSTSISKIAELVIIIWLPRSPNLTPFDFFLWGPLKEMTYRTREIAAFNND
jgi:hypothetical protein